MDPPRQVSRRTTGSGPIFRSFKRIVLPSTKMMPQPPPMLPMTNVMASNSTSSGVTAYDYDRSVKRSMEIREEAPVKVQKVPIPCVILGNKDFEAASTSHNASRNSIGKGKIGLRTVTAFPQRKHPVNTNVEIEVEEKTVFPAKKVASTRPHRTRAKRQTSVSEKVLSRLSLPC